MKLQTPLGQADSNEIDVSLSRYPLSGAMKAHILTHI